jgi:hypothetical protein
VLDRGRTEAYRLGVLRTGGSPRVSPLSVSRSDGAGLSTGVEFDTPDVVLGCRSVTSVRLPKASCSATDVTKPVCPACAATCLLRGKNLYIQTAAAHAQVAVMVP